MLGRVAHDHPSDVRSGFSKSLGDHIPGLRILRLLIIGLAVIPHPHRAVRPYSPPETVRHGPRCDPRAFLRRRYDLLDRAEFSPVVVVAVMRLQNPFPSLVINPTDPSVFLPILILGSTIPQMTRRQSRMNKHGPTHDTRHHHIPQHILRQQSPRLEARPPARLITGKLQPPPIATVIIIYPPSDRRLEFRIAPGIRILEQSRGVERFVIPVQ
mmetsp:Transcript_30817/g.74446  ORF Transcript_30817/g.74446 Transcript_30817/m.74446 type:complete len:213 (+) Transcript_30817:459-1097(+)